MRAKARTLGRKAARRPVKRRPKRREEEVEEAQIGILGQTMPGSEAAAQI